MLISDTEWVKFNVGQFGYYRVMYSKDEWINFSKLLKTNHEVLSKLITILISNYLILLIKLFQIDSTFTYQSHLSLKSECTKNVQYDQSI